MNTTIHPDMLMETILSKKHRKNKIFHLKMLNEICRKRYDEGLFEFSLQTIGSLCEAEKIISKRTLFNAASEEYRSLIFAWEALSNNHRNNDYQVDYSLTILNRISDHAIRSIVQTIIVERNKLKSENNFLRSKVKIEIDNRPHLSSADYEQGEVVEKKDYSIKRKVLTDTEIHTLENAISDIFLEQQGWKKGKNDEIVNELGRTIFDIGFISGIQKIIKLK